MLPLHRIQFEFHISKRWLIQAFKQLSRITFWVLVLMGLYHPYHLLWQSNSNIVNNDHAAGSVTHYHLNSFAISTPTQLSFSSTPTRDQNQYNHSHHPETTISFPEDGSLITANSTLPVVTTLTPSSPLVPPNSTWAYAFLLGGARLENKGSNYRAGLFSVIAAKHSLKSHGSTADVVLMVQLSVRARRNFTTLQDWEEELLRKAQIRVFYIPRFAKPKLECFYSLTMEKFRILSLTEYRRVIFMDYDIFPTCNLDYIFALSDPPDGMPPLLKENVVLGYKREPSNAGMFLLTPNFEDYLLLLKEIQRKEERALQLPYPHWDDIEGWGHTITPPDRWVPCFGKPGTRWTWAYAYADQGLLYYWTKYVKKKVSLIRRDTVENWDVDEEGQLYIESTTQRLLNQYSPCYDGTTSNIYTEFTHFTGGTKPWLVNRNEVEASLWKKPVEERTQREIWYVHLIRALTEIGMVDKVPFDFFGRSDKVPSVGRASSYVQMAVYLQSKKRRRWNQYWDPTAVKSANLPFSTASTGNGWDDEGDDEDEEQDEGHLLFEVLAAKRNSSNVKQIRR